MASHYRDITGAQAVAVARPENLSGKSGAAAGRADAYRHGLKRAFDVLGVLILAPFVVPLVALLALLVMRDGATPFYRQERVGRNGRLYTMWKLRSMVAGADALLTDHLAADPAARDEWHTSQKLRNDPRITRFGALIRKTSLDELPQLWNVLRGDMSLVGPRPMMPCQQGLYPGKSYYRLRPGITGPWQVSKRNESSFADRARFDTGYEAGLSFRSDLRYLLATVRVVLRATGC